MANNAKNQRRCIACKQHADKSEMIRIVSSKSGGVFVDETKSSDGRGAWVHDTKECKALVVKKRLLNAAFKRQIDQSVYESLSSVEDENDD